MYIPPTPITADPSVRVEAINLPDVHRWGRQVRVDYERPLKAWDIGSCRPLRSIALVLTSFAISFTIMALLTGYTVPDSSISVLVTSLEAAPQHTQIASGGGLSSVPR